MSRSLSHWPGLVSSAWPRVAPSDWDSISSSSSTIWLPSSPSYFSGSESTICSSLVSVGDPFFFLRNQWSSSVFIQFFASLLSWICLNLSFIFLAILSLILSFALPDQLTTVFFRCSFVTWRRRFYLPSEFVLPPSLSANIAIMSTSSFLSLVLSSFFMAKRVFTFKIIATRRVWG